MQTYLTVRRFLVAVVALILFTSWLLYRNVQHLETDFGWVVHTLEVQATVHSIQQDLGFLNRSVRQAWTGGHPVPSRARGEAQVRAGIDRFQQLTADNSSQQIRAAQLRALLSAYFTFVDSPENASLSVGVLESRLNIQTDRILALLGEMNAEESRLLVLRRSQAESSRRRADVGLVVSAFAALLLIGVLFWAYARAFRREQHREFQLRHLVDQLRDYSVVTLDADGRVTDCSRYTESITGFSPEELRGADHAIFYTAEERTAGLPQQTLAKARKEGHLEQEIEQSRKDGRVYWAEVLVYPVEEAGVHKGFHRLCRDISDRKALIAEIRHNAEVLEDRVAERTSALEKANISLSGFTSTVSHDLRTPLRAIWGFAKALSEDYGDALPEAGKEYVQTIISSSKRMDQLIHDLLAFSRAEDSQLVISDVDLIDVMSGALKNIAPQVAEKHGSIDTPEDLPVIRGAFSPLVQCFTNLFTNAIKYTPRGRAPHIRVTCAVNRDGMAEIHVRDNGIGIEPQHIAQLFRPFSRLHSNENYEGTGVGLAIVKSTIVRLGGKVGVSSTPNEGSDFWLTLPLARERTVHSEDHSGSRGQHNGQEVA